MSTLEKAIAIAANAHAGQIDKGGQPYILHPLRVMLAVETQNERITAVLHDVIEDTYIVESDLLEAGFSPNIIRAILALSKSEGEKRMDAGMRAARDPLARVVKMADVKDNMNLDRIPNLMREDCKRLQEYREVLEYLETHGDPG